MMNKKYKYTAVLTIAGSDSGGGAGIQADLKTFSAMGCFGTSAITAITVQNTKGVTGIHAVPTEIIKGQIEAVMSDIKPSAIKIGMINAPEVVTTIADCLKNYPTIPVVFDPVMVATSGDKLIQDETIEVLKQELFPLATLLTPNLDEAEILAEMKITSKEDMISAGKKINAYGAKAVLVKGGHLEGDVVYDVLVENGKVTVFDDTKIETTNMHGTGCTLSSAIAAELAKGNTLKTAIINARGYIRGALLHGADVKTGEGNGPLNHFYDPEKLQKHEME